MKLAPRTLTIASVAVLCFSAVANVLVSLPAATEFFPLLFWIHIAIIALGIWAVLRIRKLKSTWADVWECVILLPKALVILGIAVVVIATFSVRNINFDLGKLPDGTSVSTKNWSERNGKYWLSLNKQPEVEIDKSQYRELQRQSYAFFALGWLLFSYIIVLQWHYITRRETQRPHAA
jgi:hypothetical protein